MHTAVSPMLILVTLTSPSFEFSYRAKGSGLHSACHNANRHTLNLLWKHYFLQMKMKKCCSISWQAYIGCHALQEESLQEHDQNGNVQKG